MTAFDPEFTVHFHRILLSTLRRIMQFLLPPKDQQAKLAELLWAMDAVIEREREVLERLDLSYTALIEKKLINKNSPKLYFSDLLKVIRGVGYKPEQLLEVVSFCE
jgi:hypothetical protein